jgi:hypothetical protein
MSFDKETIARMNEPTVREEIIAPILSRLNYKFGTTNYIEREERLPDVVRQIGRPSAKDYPLGKPDYMCGVDGRRGSFVVEAKSGDVEISDAEIAQTHSYAAHGKINAKFFVMCNGRKFQIYETAAGIDADPLVDVEYANLERDFFKLEALLSPEKLIQHSKVTYEIAKSLGAELGAIEKVKFGWVDFSECRYELLHQPAGTFLNLLGFSGKREKFEADVAELLTRRQPIIDGTVKRNADGRIEAHLEFDSALEWISSNMAIMGINKLMFITEADEISEAELNPTVFESLSNFSLPVGLELRQGLTAELEKLQMPVNLSMKFTAFGSLKGRQFLGNYDSTSLIDVPVGADTLQLVCEYKGNFNLAIQ